MKSMGLYRRKNHDDLLDVATFLINQQGTSGVLHGYRWMHLKCVQAGFSVPRDTVYELMKVLDPDGMKSRLRRRLRRRRYASRGPNYVWHIDGYDKLKPFGIAINGCMDGFSRCMIWLEAASTNNDPKVIGNYFINAVKERGGCPKRVRGDLGTENVYVENMQKFLRRNHEDDLSGDRSYMSGRSTLNQRIEWFWGLLRKEMAQFYMDLFADLGQDGNDFFRGDMLDKYIIQFCFMNVIQANLDEVCDIWNTHRLQSNDNRVGGGKRPILLYSLPHLYGLNNHICQVEETEVDICAEETTPKPSCGDNTASELCEILMEKYHMSEPTSATEAKELYMRLRQMIRSELGDI
ncbi:hypothetical protein FSP39_021324 [Pinctada imbricata]|uniref:Integrase core domain-containing protein n=1 Tax=Pinctada imbricata TaxID=66713 RepID=A0AA89BMT1_PINIB|nr:hypothetical protein FSP39_021324 [Pinctada imbricata]